MFRYPKDVGFLPVKKVVNKTAKEFKQSYGCDICSDGGWTSETEVEIHKTKVHYTRIFMKELRKRDDFCFICIKECESKEAVIKHIKTEHLLSTENCIRVEREIFICNTCSAIFFNKENLVIHLRYAHLNMKKMLFIQCLFCTKNILVRNIPAHFYMHNIQSVSTCRICLMKCANTKELKEHLKKHPYYLKCDMCYYETNKVESFHSHVLNRHKIDVNTKMSTTENVITGDMSMKSEPIADETVHSSSYVNPKMDSISTIQANDDVDKASEKDLMTIIEVIDKDGATDNVMYCDVKGDTTKKKNLKGVKKKNKKKEIATQNLIAVGNLMKDAAMTVTDVTDNVSTDKDLSTDDDSFTNSDLFTVEVADYVIEDVIKSESVKEKDVIMYPISEDNLITLDDITDRQSVRMTDDVIYKGFTNQGDSMSDQENDDNVMTVIEISDNARGTSTESVSTFSFKVPKTVEKTAEDFKRFFIPESPAYLRLQRIAGLRGVKLSNGVHVCILCREVCVGLEEMKSHIDEHNVKKEKTNNYECSCGEKFTNRVLLKHHTFKSKHAIK